MVRANTTKQVQTTTKHDLWFVVVLLRLISGGFGCFKVQNHFRLEEQQRMETIFQLNSEQIFVAKRVLEEHNVAITGQVVVVVVCSFLQCLDNFTLANKCPYFEP